MSKIGELVRRARLGKDMTQAELAERLDMSEARIDAFERGDETPSPDTLGDIEDALGLSPGQIAREAGVVEGP
ncbi:MAG: helix-turn-helix domain-containing protein [Actinomycetota bacterium]|nr:helix-turn-helix domain-containing protein [Actinomycetota bacterium]